MSSKLIYLSSITKKVVLSLAGLFLIIFLVLHLSINLLLLKPDEGEWFRAASHFMGHNYVIKVMEVVLLLAILIHVLLGVILQIQNWRARPVKYAVKSSSQKSFFSKYMIHTGIIIGIFLGMHFLNFYFVKLGFVAPPEGVDREDLYQMAKLLFANKSYCIIYIVFMAFLGFHLNHAFQSAFQSLGLNHSKYTPAIKGFGTIYSIIIPLGFAVIPAYFLLFG